MSSQLHLSGEAPQDPSSMQEQSADHHQQRSEQSNVLYQVYQGLGGPLVHRDVHQGTHVDPFSSSTGGVSYTGYGGMQQQSIDPHDTPLDSFSYYPGYDSAQRQSIDPMPHYSEHQSAGSSNYNGGFAPPQPTDPVPSSLYRPDSSLGDGQYGHPDHNMLANAALMSEQPVSGYAAAGTHHVLAMAPNRLGIQITNRYSDSLANVIHVRPKFSISTLF